MTVLDSARSRAPGVMVRSREAELAGLPMVRARDISPEEEMLIRKLEKHLAGSPQSASIRSSLLDPRVSHIDMRGDPAAQKILNEIEALRSSQANRLFAAEQRERASTRESPVTIAIPDVFPLADTSIVAIVLRRAKEDPRDVVLLRRDELSPDAMGAALRRLNIARQRDGDSVTIAQVLPIREHSAPASWQANGLRSRANEDLMNLLRSNATIVPGVGPARSMQIMLTRKTTPP
jgi:hypothetical protein